MKKSFFAMIAGTALALWTVVPFVYGQEAFLIQEEVVGPNLKYMSGGVGIEERDAMKAQAGKGYDLKLEFAVPHGNYLSVVDVKINDQSGKPVITAESNGPWFYADLPKGTYTVVANHEGGQKTQKVTVDGGLKTVVMYFNSEQPGEIRAGSSGRRHEGSTMPAKKGESGQTEQSK